MKTVVSVNEMSEFEIKPTDALKDWKEIVSNEISECWSNLSSWESASCPVCGSENSILAFSKGKFTYEECRECKTLYAKTRPSTKELNWWYTNSLSVKKWQENLLELSAASREAKIIEPRANWILDGLSEYLPGREYSDIKISDISFFGKALLEKIACYAPSIKLTAAGITSGNEKYTVDAIKVKPVDSLEEFSAVEPADVLIAIDLFERVPDIRLLMAQAGNIVQRGGLFFATCPVSSGFEIQSLWDKSPTVSIPDKLNLPTVTGIINQISATEQWEILELSTPGMFDVEIVKRIMLQLPDEDWPRPLKALMNDIDQRGMEHFTEYLQSQRQSSFARMVLRKQS